MFETLEFQSNPVMPLVKSGSLKKLLWLVPMPPPYAGPELVSKHLFEAFAATTMRNASFYVNSTLRSANNKKGKFDAEGVFGACRVYFEFISALIKQKPTAVYVLFASAKMAFLRDALHILTAKAFGCKVVAQYHGGNFQGFYAGQGACMQKIIRVVLKKTDCIIALGNNLRAPFQKIDPDLHIEALYNGLPANHFVHTRSRRKTKKVNLFFMGHLTFAKGFYDLIAAYKDLRKKYPSLHLHFAGTRHLMQDCGQIASFLTGKHKQYYLSNSRRIHDEIDAFCCQASAYGATYHGIVDFDQKLQLFSQSDIFVLPSYTEGFSLSVLEAMFMGLPVVVTGVGALPEVVANGENGFVIEPGNRQALEDRLERLIASRELRERMGNTNEKYARERFSIDRIAGELNEIFERICSR